MSIEMQSLTNNRPFSYPALRNVVRFTSLETRKHLSTRLPALENVPQFFKKVTIESNGSGGVKHSFVLDDMKYVLHQGDGEWDHPTLTIGEFNNALYFLPGNLSLSMAAQCFVNQYLNRSEVTIEHLEHKVNPNMEEDALFEFFGPSQLCSIKFLTIEYHGGPYDEPLVQKINKIKALEITVRNFGDWRAEALLQLDFPGIKIVEILSTKQLFIKHCEKFITKKSCPGSYYIVAEIVDLDKDLIYEHLANHFEAKGLRCLLKKRRNVVENGVGKHYLTIEIDENSELVISARTGMIDATVGYKSSDDHERPMRKNIFKMLIGGVVFLSIVVLLILAIWLF